MNRRGVTLIEMLIVAGIIGIIVSISFPSIAAGLDGIRLRSAADSVVAILNTALVRTDRREEPMELVVIPREATISLYAADPNYLKQVRMPDGVHMVGEEPRRFLLQPGGAPPRLDIDLYNDRGTHKVVRIDPITGVPQT